MTSGSQDQPRWLEVAVEVAGIDAELAADLLRQGCQGGVAIEAPSRLDRENDAYVLDGDASALVKGYLRADADAERLQSSMHLALQTAPLQQPAIWHDTRELAEADWRDSWKKYFGIQRVGHNVVIVPSWIEYMEKPGQTVIRIDPGMAFGTGQHPTTAMCLTALEELVVAGVSVLDLGCGSGILAIAASKLGAGHVLAIDIDEQAVKAATANTTGNSVAVDVREGSLGAGASPTERFDIVVANISGVALERLAIAIVTTLNDGGRLIASGFLDDRVDGLRDTFVMAGLTIERVVEDGVWRAIVARRA